MHDLRCSLFLLLLEAFDFQRPQTANENFPSLLADRLKFSI